MKRLDSQDSTFIHTMKQKIAKGEPIYVRIIKEGSREGSVGRLVDPKIIKTRSYYGAHPKERFAATLTLAWDDRTTTLEGIEGYFLKWDPEATGTTWVFKTNKVAKLPAVAISDRMGIPLEVGDVVMVSVSQHKLQIGKIVRRSDKGSVWVKPSPMIAGEAVSNEIRLTPTTGHYQNLLRMDKDLFGRLVLAKLAS
jgi:hypothetical protein